MGDHDIRNHQSMEERREVAGMCEVALQYGIKTYVDEMDDAVSKSYALLCLIVSILSAWTAAYFMLAERVRSDSSRLN